jgi:hypothetical protein
VLDRFAQAIEKSGIDVVPRIVMNAGSSSDAQGAKGPGSGSMLETLLALALSSKLDETLATTPSAARNPRAQALLDDIQKRIADSASHA